MLSKSKAGGWRYDITGLGMKINMADVNAAIGLAQIRIYEDLLKERKRVFDTSMAKHLNNMIGQFYHHQNKVKKKLHITYMLYVLKILLKHNEMQMIDEIAKSEVAVNVHFIPMPMLTLFKNLGYKIEDYPQAYNNYKCEISLPIYPQLTDEQVKFVIETVVNAYNKVK